MPNEDSENCLVVAPFGLCLMNWIRIMGLDDVCDCKSATPGEWWLLA